VIRRNLRTSTGIAILCALAFPLMLRGTAAQEVLKVPEGLPDWA
jgi:hypothetical protein